MSDKETALQNNRIWNKVAQPPKEMLKQIPAGRQKGKTSIEPQWRLQALTDIFGPCGIGWKLEIPRLWTEPGSDEQVFAFAHVLLYVREKDGKWSDPIPGVGGSMLVAKEYSAHKKMDVLFSDDDAFKKATTDAVSVACKELGFGAAIYLNQWDGGKYILGPMTIDENKLADWLLATEAAAEEELADFLVWWPDKKETLIKDLGEGGAARVHAKYVGLLKTKQVEARKKKEAVKVRAAK